MLEPAQRRIPLLETAMGVAPRLWWLIGAATALLVAAFVMQEPHMRLALATVGGVFVAVAGLGGFLSWRRQLYQDRTRRQLVNLVAYDAAPTFITDSDGHIIYQNGAARERFAVEAEQSLIRAMRHMFVNPSAVMFRLQSKAGSDGAAREDVVTQRGHARLSVHEVGHDQFLWRLEEMQDRGGAPRGAEGLSLPMLVASKGGTVLFMNEALRRLLGGRPKTLDRIFAQLPLRSGEEALVSTQDGPVRALVAELEGAGDRREIYLFTDLAPEARPAADQAAFEDLPVALARIAPDGTVGQLNRLARELLVAEDGEQLIFADLVEGLGRPVGEWVADILAGRAPQRAEVLRATRAEPERFLQISLRRTVDHGRPGILAVINDATELKTLEAQVVQIQKMQAIGQLAGGVAHDFNNLLTAITGHCDLLLLRHEKGDPDYGDLIQVNQNANRAASLVRQLLAFSRKQTMKPSVVDLREALGDLTHLLNRLVGEKVTLSRSYDDELWFVRADRRQLDQVMMNLVVNARDAMPQGGTIWIETENLRLSEDLSRDRAVVPEGEYVVVRVRDEGIGIAPEKLPKIFEPFFTTKRTGEGTGLGLSTVYGIIKQSGGFIFVDSIIGTGTTFSIYLPAHRHSEDVVQVGAAPAAPHGESTVEKPNGAPVDLPSETPPERSEAELRPGEGVILLVEDEAPVRAFAARALRLRGYTVLEAENAEAALSTLDDPNLQVDVFVTDVIMPGMDGPSWVREALKSRPDVRVIFVSGYAEDSFVDTQTRIPNSVFLPKPFSLAELTATVQGQIH